MSAFPSREGARWAVIFYARMGKIDDDYRALAPRLRQLAESDYGCLGMQSACENGLEISISYWASEADIRQWRDCPLHRQARRLARERGWYTQVHSQRVQLESE